MSHGNLWSHTFIDHRRITLEGCPFFQLSQQRLLVSSTQASALGPLIPRFRNERVTPGTARTLNAGPRAPSPINCMRGVLRLGSCSDLSPMSAFGGVPTVRLSGILFLLVHTSLLVTPTSSPLAVLLAGALFHIARALHCLRLRRAMDGETGIKRTNN